MRMRRVALSAASAGVLAGLTLTSPALAYESPKPTGSAQAAAATSVLPATTASQPSDANNLGYVLLAVGGGLTVIGAIALRPRRRTS